MTLYSLNGGYPAPLSFDDMADPSGKLWTRLKSSPEGLEACGFVVAPDPPAYNAATQALAWADGAWTVTSLPLDTLKASAIGRAQAEFANRLAEGAPSGSERVQLDDGSQARLTAIGTTALAAASGQAPWPDGYARGWIAIGGTRIPLATPTDGLTFSAAVGAYYSDLVQHEEDLEIAIKAATDAAGVAAVDVTAGWPS